MCIQISRIVLASNRPNLEQFYFKIEASDVFFSRVTRKETIEEDVSININQMTPIIFEIWSYYPLKIIKFWKIPTDFLSLSNRKYVIKDEQWSIRFDIEKEDDVSLNKESKKSKQNKTASSSKDLKVMNCKKIRNKSGYKDINVSVLKKNKDKVGVKKALKTTIDQLVKQNKKPQKYEDYVTEQFCHIKSAYTSPNLMLKHGTKNQSVLFSQYGFSSTQFNEKFQKKERMTSADEQTQRFVKFEKKKKARLR